MDTNHLHLELAIFEKDILKVKVGQKISFIVPEATKEVFAAEVHLVGKSIEGNDRAINVNAHLDDKIKQKLLTGMFVEAKIKINSKQGLAIPIDALISENNKNFVLLLDNDMNNKFSFKKVGVQSAKSLKMLLKLFPTLKLMLLPKF